MDKKVKIGRTIGGWTFLAITLIIAIMGGLWMWWVLGFLFNIAGVFYDFAANRGLDDVDS